MVINSMTICHFNLIDTRNSNLSIKLFTLTILLFCNWLINTCNWFKMSFSIFCYRFVFETDCCRRKQHYGFNNGRLAPCGYMTDDELCLFLAVQSDDTHDLRNHQIVHRQFAYQGFFSDEASLVVWSDDFNRMTYIIYRNVITV